MVTLLLAALMAAHPLHTTMTELSVDPANHTVRAVTRVFADDLLKGSGGRIAADAYVTQRIALVDQSQRAVALRGCGVKTVGDLLWVCIEGTFNGSIGDLRLSNALLCDRFDDQVNIVQVVVGTAKRSVLFVKGDRAKTIS